MEQSTDPSEGDQDFGAKLAVEFAPPETRRQKLWSFLNSQFGMWLVGTVIASTIVSGGTALWRYRDRSVEKDVTIAKLDREIAARLDHMARAQNRTVTLRSFVALIESLDNPTTGNRYPEYRNRSLVSLIDELHDLVPVSQQSALARARDAAAEIAAIAVRGREEIGSLPADDQQGSLDFNDFSRVMKLDNEDLNLKRWPSAKLY